MLLRRSFLAAAAAAIPAGARTSAFPETGYAPVNGLKLYEIHGAGRPLILLHGGLGATEIFGPIFPCLQTIAS